jgi:hypothetical protein
MPADHTCATCARYQPEGGTENGWGYCTRYDCETDPDDVGEGDCWEEKEEQ